jgi:hypothetical protein
MTEETLEEKLARYEFVLDAYVRELTTLREENERLRSVAGAHEVLKNIYADPTQPTGHRIKAAGLALGHESAPLKPVEPPLELAAEVIEPLADVIARQRARVERMEREARDIRVLPNGQVLLLGGDGSDGSGSND